MRSPSLPAVCTQFAHTEMSVTVLCILVQKTGFVYACTENWFCVNFYSILVLCKLLQHTGFVYQNQI